jgi:hypothetical protein
MPFGYIVNDYNTFTSRKTISIYSHGYISIWIGCIKILQTGRLVYLFKLNWQVTQHTLFFDKSLTIIRSSTSLKSGIAIDSRYLDSVEVNVPCSNPDVFFGYNSCRYWHNRCRLEGLLLDVKGIENILIRISRSVTRPSPIVRTIDFVVYVPVVAPSCSSSTWHRTRFSWIPALPGRFQHNSPNTYRMMIF